MKEEFVFFICKSHKLSAKKDTHIQSEKVENCILEFVLCVAILYFCCLVPK